MGILEDAKVVVATGHRKADSVDLVITDGLVESENAAHLIPGKDVTFVGRVAGAQDNVPVREEFEVAVPGKGHEGQCE